MERQDTESRFVERVGHFAKTAAGPVFGDPSFTGSACFPSMEAAREGLTGIQVPVGSGGLGYSFSCKSQCCEILARADFGFAMSVVNTQNVAQKLAATASEELKQRTYRLYCLERDRVPLLLSQPLVPTPRYANDREAEWQRLDPDSR